LAWGWCFDDLALWGIMALLVLLTTRTKPPEVEAVEQPAEPPTETDYKAEAAAVAVAFALTQTARPPADQAEGWRCSNQPMAAHWPPAANQPRD